MVLAAGTLSTGMFFSTENAAAPATAPEAAGTQDLPTKGESLDSLNQGVLPLGMSLEQPLCWTATLLQLPFTGLVLWLVALLGDCVRRRRLRAAPRNSQRSLRLEKNRVVGAPRRPRYWSGGFGTSGVDRLEAAGDERKERSRGSACSTSSVSSTTGAIDLGRIDRRAEGREARGGGAIGGSTARVGSDADGPT